MPISQQDFSFVGSAYTAADEFQDRQICINWFLEIDKTQGARTPTALLGTPGLIQVASALGMTTIGQVSTVPAPTILVPLPPPTITG